MVSEQHLIRQHITNTYIIQIEYFNGSNDDIVMKKFSNFLCVTNYGIVKIKNH